MQALVEAIVAAAADQIAADAERMASSFRAAHDPLDTHAMLAEGLAAVEAIERDRQRRHDARRADRERGEALYESTRAQHLRELGRPPVPVPSRLARQDLAAYNSLTAWPEHSVMGTVPPDPSQTRLVIF